MESLIYGYPIPPVYTYRNDENQLEILDGQQRIMSLFFYYIGYYLNRKKNSSINFSDLIIGNGTLEDALLKQFELEKLHIDLEGKNGQPINVDYANLSADLKRKIDYTTITVIEIKIDNEEQKQETLREISDNLNRDIILL